MNKKKDPRNHYIDFRVSKNEKKLIHEQAHELSMDVSQFIRMKLGLSKDNE